MAQHTITNRIRSITRSTAAWFCMAALCNAQTMIPLADQHAVPPRSEAAFAFDLPTIPPGHQIRLGLDARNDWDLPAGSWPTMTVTLNGQDVVGSRIINKPLRFTTRNGSGFTWAAADKSRYRLVHAPDFSDATATDETYEYGTPDTDPFRFVWDITPLVRPGANRLVVQSSPDLNFTICLRNVGIEIGSPIPSKNIDADRVHESFAKAGTAMWDPSLHRDETGKLITNAVAPAPTGPLPVFQPGRRPAAPAAIEVSSLGRLRFQAAERSFTVRSRTSLPDGKWSHADVAAESWRRLGQGETTTLSWVGAGYAVSRRIALRADHLAVADTIQNTATQLVGVIIENRLEWQSKPDAILVTGRPIQKHFRQRSNPAHPTALAEYDNLAIGLVAEDDIFRIHSRAFAEDDAIGISDPMLGIAPGQSHTLEWSIYSCPNGDYWTFINAIRRNWNSNRTLVGPSKWETPLSVPGQVEQIDAWSQRAPVITLCNPRVTREEARRPGDEDVSVQHGTSFLACKAWCRQAREAAQRIRRVNPDAHVMIYTHQNICGEPGIENLFTDSRAMTPGGRRGRTAYRGEHGLFLPTLENSYGKALMNVYRFIVEELDADLYIDEITASNVTPFGQYDAWDGCTVVIDPKTHAVTGRLSSAVLLMQPWRAAIMDYLRAKGRRIVTANGAHYTRTMLSWTNLQCFNEADLGSDLVIDLHLSHPLCIAQPYGPNSDERIQARYKAARGLLMQGGIQWTSFSSECPIYPITPLELHAGYIIGEERILTVRSGQFGWGDASRADVHVFDGAAKRVDRPDVREIKAGKQVLTGLRMPGDHFAVLVRKRVKGE